MSLKQPAGQPVLISACGILVAACSLFWPVAAEAQTTETKSTAPHATVEIGELGSDAIVSLGVGDTLRVVLPTNPSTGYSWLASGQDTAVLEPVTAEARARRRQLPGAPSVQTMEYTARSSGRATLTFNYSRPWEKHEKPARTYPVTVTVGQAGSPAVTPSGRLLGIYTGKLPCADCSGIVTLVAFYKPVLGQATESFYVRTMNYLGASKGDNTFISSGSWSEQKGTAADPQTAVYALQSSGSDNTENYQLKGDTLIALGKDGKPIQGPFDMNLKKQPQ